MLRNMLLDERYVPPPLFLKLDHTGDLETRKIEVRRVRRQGRSYIDKRYVGDYANRANEESQMLEVMRTQALVKDYVVEFSGKAFSAQSVQAQSLDITTRWSGLSIQNWLALWPAQQSPFASLAALLALVRAIVKALEEFHKLGFVHGDLLPQNLVMPAIKLPNGRYQLQLQHLRLIDFEFSLAPAGGIASHGTVQLIRKTDWFKDKHGQLIRLHPACHSAQLLPAPARYVPDRGFKGAFKWEWGATYPDAKARMARVNWTADFFSLAHWLEPLVMQGNFNDEDALPTAVPDLMQLIDDMRSWDLLHQTGAPGVPLPQHGAIIDRINRLIGAKDPEHELSFELPSRNALKRLDQHSPLGGEDNSVAADTAFDGRRTVIAAITKVPWAWLAYGGALLAVGVSAVSWGMPNLESLAKKFIPAAGDATATAMPPPQPTQPLAPVPTADELLAVAQAALMAGAPGSKEWQTALAAAAKLAQQPDVTPPTRNRFWAELQTRYLAQTAAIVQGSWWNEPEPDKGKPNPQGTAWLAASSALAAQGSWLAATYEARAIASRRGGTQPSPAQVARARANLAQWATNPNTWPFEPLGTAQQLAFQLEIAQLLTDIALVEAHHAKNARQALPTLPTQQLLPLLQALSALPSQHGQMLLGVAAICLEQPPNTKLAQAEFTKATRAGTGTDSKAIATDATAWLQGKNACL